MAARCMRLPWRLSRPPTRPPWCAPCIRTWAAPLRLWGARQGEGHEFDAVADAAKAFASGLQRPYCGTATAQESLAWFGEAAAHLHSMTQVPLREPGGACFGLLVMASEDPHRFYPELGTLYLERIGEMAAAALLRVVA